MVGTNHTPWYPPYTERLVDVLKETANMHTNLLPFIKSHTYQATQNGVPLIRAMFLEYPNDAKVWEMTDQYAFGVEFLVAPIVTQGGMRDVYFPEGSLFLEYFNKTDVYAGGTTYSVDMEWEYVPVYVREGAIIPTGDIYQGNYKWGEWTPYLEIEVFPSYNVQNSTFEYYDATKNGTVLITATTDKDARSVHVVFGDLGVKTTLVIYGSCDTYNFVLEGDGGDVTLVGFESLFG